MSSLPRIPLCAVDKLTKQIRVGPVLLVSERLHANLIRVSQLIGNAPMLNALRMSASEGSEIIIGKLDKSQRTNLDKARRFDDVIHEYLPDLEACAEANGCDEATALDVILSIGARHGVCNGWQAPEREKEGKRRA